MNRVHGYDVCVGSPYRALCSHRDGVFRECFDDHILNRSVQRRDGSYRSRRHDLNVQTGHNDLNHDS